MSNRLNVLLEHQGFVRALARSLVVDDHAAADVSQDVWLASIVRPPEDQGTPRGWLARVVRNQASNRRKAEWRRHRREAAAASPHGVHVGPSPEGILELERVRRVVVEAVIDLPERYRTPVLLRYYEDLTPREIARRIGVPVDTVKTQLRRAHERLRLRLAREAEGNERAYGAALLALAEKTPGTIAALVAGGGGFVLAKLVAAAAVVFVGCLAAIEWTRSETSPVVASESSHAPIVDVVISTTAVADASPAPERATAPARQDDGESASALTGRCVDGAARPLAGVRVLVVQWPDMEEVVTDDDGLFRILRAGEEEELTLRTHRSGWARNWYRQPWPASAAVDIGDIILEPAAIVRGHLADVDGSPIAGARIVLSNVQDSARDERSLWRPLTETMTDAAGDFFLDDSPADWVVIRAIEDGEFVTWSDQLGLTPGDSNEFVALRAGLPAEARHFRVRVLQVDGTPIQSRGNVGVSIRRGDGEISPEYVTLDDRGEITFPVRGDERISMTVEDRFGRTARASDLRPSPETFVLRVRDAPLAHVEVRSKRDGSVVERAKCIIWAVPDSGPTVLRSGLCAGVEGPGRRAFVLPEGRFYVEVTSRGFLRSYRGPFEGAPPDPILVELEPTSTVSGVVLADGAPLEGALVRLFLSSGSPPDKWPESHADGAPIEATTGEDGRFRLEVPEVHDYLLRAEHPELAHSEVGPLALDPAGENEDIEIRMTPGGAVEGRLTVPSGLGLVAFSVYEMQGGSSALTVHPEGVVVDDNGMYRLDRLAPGPVRLYVSKPCCPSQDYFLRRFTCDVREGEVTRFDLEVLLEPPLAVRGRLTLNREPRPDVTVLLLPVPPELPRELAALSPAYATRMNDSFIAWTANDTADPEGRFSLPVDEPGEYVLEFKTGVFDLRTPITVGEGDDERVFDIETGSVRGLVRERDGEDVHLLWRGPSGAWVSLVDYAGLDGEEAYAFPCVPAGRVFIQLGDGPVHETTVFVGEELRFDIP